MSTEEIRFELVNHYKYNERGANGEWYASLFAELVTYYRGQSYGHSEVSVVGQGYSESAALADVQFKFQQKLESLKQEKRASFSSQSSSYSSYSPSSYSYSSGGTSRNVSNAENFFSLLWFLLTCAIAIVIMRSTFPTYFPTRNYFPVNLNDWGATIFYGLIPIPIGWIAWITVLGIGTIGVLGIVAFFSKNAKDAEQFFAVLGLLASSVIAIIVMRSTFPTYFPTRNWFPANFDDWGATIFYALFPIPIGWVAWATFLGLTKIGMLGIDALFSKKAKDAEQFFVVLGLLASSAIAIIVMRSTFPIYFPTTNWLPANFDDWGTTMFYAFFPTPIGWVAWITFLGIGLICYSVIKALFSKK